MATLYVDYEGGNDANNGTSYALRKKTITSASSVASAGDTVRVMASPAATNMGNAAWTNLSPTVTLASGRTANIYLDGAWTAAANVTATTSTTRKEGSNSSSLAFAAGFTTGLAGYYATGTLNLSSYQKISFWIRSSAAVADASIYQIKLCSDTAGATPVDTLTLPAIALIANTWAPITIDKGSALGASIASVALYTSSDPGTPTILLDNIFATNDLSLTSLIGKNSGSELWWQPRSISTTTIILEQGPNSSAATASRGYVGTTEAAVTTYCREPIPVATVTAATTDLFTIGTSGSAGSPITFSGGWNRTDMSTQTDVTWFSGQNGYGELLGISAKTYNSFEKINGVFMSSFLSAGGASNNITATSCNVVASMNQGIFINTTALTQPVNTLTSCSAIQGASVGIYLPTNSQQNLTSCRSYTNLDSGIYLNLTMTGSVFSGNDSQNNTGNGIECAGAENIRDSSGTYSNNTLSGISLSMTVGCKFYSATASSNGVAGVSFTNSPQNAFYSLTTASNTSGSIDIVGNSASGENYFYNWTRSESTALVTPVNYLDSMFYSVSEGSATNHAIYTDNGTIVSDATVRHTASGISWKLSPTSTIRDSAYPLVQRVAAVAVKANVAQTATIWLRRTNTGLTGTFRIRGGQILGVAADVTASISVAADTWEQLTLNFTPTADGVVEFEVLCYGGTTYSLYWDDFAISAASYINASSGDYGWLMQGAYIGSAGASMRSYTFG